MSTTQVARDGFELVGIDEGAGDPALVFVHGWTCNRSHFQPQIDHFAATHRCVAFDHRGHGTSGRPAGDDYAIATLAADVAAIIETLELDRPVVVGHSMGAATAFELAAHRPELVRGIVLVDSAPLVPSPIKEMMGGLLTQLDDPATAAQVRRDTAGGLMFLPTSDPALVERVVDEMVATDLEVARSCWAGIVDYDATASPTVHVPAMHVGAAVPINEDDALRAIMPDVRLEEARDVGHFIQLEAPDRIIRLIDAFLDENAADRS